jgi:hypothetical protein
MTVAAALHLPAGTAPRKQIYIVWYRSQAERRNRLLGTAQYWSVMIFIL